MAATPSAARPAAQSDDVKYKGQLMGLPATGAGSMAPVGRRLGAVVIDWAISYGLALALYGSNVTTRGQFIPLSILAVCYLIGLVINGSTFGMLLLGIRVTAEDGGKPGMQSIVTRTLLLFLAIPAIYNDADGRPFHDKVAKTVTVNAR